MRIITKNKNKENVEEGEEACKKDKKSENRAAPPPTLLGEVLRLVLKIALIMLAVLLLFAFMFGAVRYSDNSMEPAVKTGDIIFFYRLDQRYAAKDVVVVEYEGKKQVRRVVAVAGDTVDITLEGLFINGSLQQEADIYTNTQPYLEGIEFPVTLAEGEVFLLGDNRTNATDSRIYGPVKVKDTLGKVMTVIRRRGI